MFNNLVYFLNTRLCAYTFPFSQNMNILKIKQCTIAQNRIKIFLVKKFCKIGLKHCKYDFGEKLNKISNPSNEKLEMYLLSDYTATFSLLFYDFFAAIYSYLLHK